jgi:hypothetical protein
MSYTEIPAYLEFRRNNTGADVYHVLIIYILEMYFPDELLEHPLIARCLALAIGQPLAFQLILFPNR